VVLPVFGLPTKAMVMERLAGKVTGEVVSAFFMVRSPGWRVTGTV
jgi:hypothetical protein